MTRSPNKGVVRLSGRDYHTVAKRIADFRADHPIREGWGILTEILIEDTDRKLLRIKARIVDPEGRTVAEGMAQEFASDRGVNRDSLLENCETSAVGRCLAAAGYVASGFYASADEVQRAEARDRQRTEHQAGRTDTPRTSASTPRTSPRLCVDNWRAFNTAIEGLGVSLADINKFCGEFLTLRSTPIDWDSTSRERFFTDLKNGTFKDLYTPTPTPAAESTPTPATGTSPHGAPVPVEFTEGKNPSFDKKEAARFCASLGDLDGLRYNDLADWLDLIHGFPRPSQCSTHYRERLYKWLRFSGGREAIAADLDKLTALRAARKVAQAAE